MIICIIGYVVLLFLVLQKRKRKIFVRCEEKTGRQILLILFCANTIALGLFWLDRQEKDSVRNRAKCSMAEGIRRETYEITVGHDSEKKRDYR
ncbi:MAG: hypothetical protein ACLTKE_04220 [Coprococcus sp.]